MIIRFKYEKDDGKTGSNQIYDPRGFNIDEIVPVFVSFLLTCGYLKEDIEAAMQEYLNKEG